MDPEAQAWIEHVRENVLPAMEGSAVIAQLVTDSEPDIKFAVEVGLSILLDKPIVTVAANGAEVPPKLAKIADRIIKVDLTTEEGRELMSVRLAEAMEELM